MKIGVIGALDEELNPIRAFTQHLEKKQKGNRVYWHGDVYGHELFVTRCDVGKVNAAIAAQQLIDHFGVEAIFNMGSSGALAPELEVGDLVIATECIQHDFDLTSWDLKPGEILFDVQMDPAAGMKFRAQQIFNTDEKLSTLVSGLANKIELSGVMGHSPRVYSGRILSGDQFVGQLEKAKGLWNGLQGLCTDMEAAAIAQTCSVNGVRFLCVRAMSDKADHSATVAFTEFLTAATVNYGRLFEHVFKELK
jgi:adenosylhomocysteine nucleosidase